jgi:hypothetical protein
MRQGARLDLEAESLIATATSPELLAQMYAAWLHGSTAVWYLHILRLPQLLKMYNMYACFY